ncbi:MAG: hypothetical protein AB7N99_07980 [Simkaniaceae bacterium]
MNLLNSLKHYANLNFTNIYLIKQIVHAAIDHCRSYSLFQSKMDQVDKYLFATDLIFMCWSGLHLDKEIPWRAPSTWNTVLSSGSIVGVGFVSYLGISLLNTAYNSRRPNLEELIDNIPLHQRENIQVRWERPEEEKYTQCLSVIEMTLTLALAYFSNSPQPYWGIVLLQLYSFYIFTDTPWLKFERKMGNPGVRVSESPVIQEALDRVNQFVFSSYFLMLPKKNPREEESCAICLETKPDTYHCIHHLFHRKCIVGHLYGKSENFISGFQVMAQIQNGQAKNLRFTLREDRLPSCPNCRRDPLRFQYKVLTIGH